MSPEGGTTSVSDELTKIFTGKTPSTTLGRSISQETYEVEASPPPQSRPTSTRHRSQEATIVGS
jgi:hypothetical protein